MAQWNGAALRSLSASVGKLAHPDPKPLLVAWCRIIEQDTHRGLDEGTDKDGQPFERVKYRPIKSATKKSQKFTRKQQAALAARSPHTGAFGETSYDNLRSAQYRRLAGKPLTPRGRNSRLHKNLYSAFLKTAANVWRATGAWRRILSKKGKPFMNAHFDGLNGLPKRDPCGVRPWGIERAIRALDDWTYAVVNGFHRSV